MIQHRINTHMKKILLTIIAVVLAVISVQAQRLEVVDSDGNGVAYASVLNSDAEYVGITDLDGVVADLAGCTDITITHVAFKSKRVKINGDNVRVVLEDADFDMPEIVVSPKPYVYVQTYYRMYYYSGKDGIIYYRTGVTDNVYDLEKKKLSASTSHMSKAEYGLIKTVMGMFGSLFDRQSRISTQKMENRLISRGKAVQLKITDAGPHKKNIIDNKGTIGHITDDMDSHQRYFAYNTHILARHLLEAEGDAKSLEKKKKRDEKKKDRKDMDFCIYHIDDAGNYAPEDLMVMQYMSSWDEVEEGETDHVITALQVFSTDRAYVTKDELKKRKKDNKIKMNYANIQQFERDHNIPALAPSVQQKLDELCKK